MIGKTLSHYEILSKLGEGGMGEVWEANDPRLDRVVAIKLIPKHLSADPTARKRFVHEAKAASSIEHANICTIHEIDETSEGETFIVMPRYQGEPLSELIARERLPLRDALHIVEDLAGAMAEAHDHDIIHRDVKPANIIIDQNGRPILLDFGLAKLSTHTQLTKTGTTLGTLAYMAPEQAAGGEVDGRADLFSLGVILYELVTGVRPFTGDHDAAVLYSIAHQPAPPLATHDPSLPLALQLIIDRALAKEPKDRYATMHELKEAIKELRRELQIGSGSRQSNLGRARTRPRWMAPVAAVLVIAVALAVWKFLPTGSGEAEAAVHALAIVGFRDLNTPDDLHASAGMIELVNIGLIENSPIRVVSPEYLQDLRRRLFGSGRGPIEDDQILEVARKAGATLLLAGRMGRMGDEQFVTWRLVDTRSGESVEARKVEGRKLSVLVDQIVTGVLPVVAEVCGVEVTVTPVAVDRITTESPEAYQHYIAGVLFRENEDNRKALDEFKKAVAADSTFALAHLELGRMYWTYLVSVRNEDMANAHLEQADSLKARLGSKDRLRLEATRYQLQRQIPKSIATYKKILERWPDDRKMLGELMVLYWMSWDIGAAGMIAEKGLELYPDNYQDYATIYSDMLVLTGRAQEAELAARGYIERDPEELHGWALLARVWLRSGEPDSAVAAHQKAVEINPSRDRLDWSAYYAYFFGDLDRAVALLERVLKENDLTDYDRMYTMTTSATYPGLSVYYYEGGHYIKMLEVVDEAQQYSQDGRSEWAFNKGLALLSIGRAREALEIADEMPDRYSDLSAPWYSLRLRARAMTALGNLEAARKAVAELYTAQEQYGGKARLLALKTEVDIALAEKDPATALAALDKMYERGIGVGLLDIETREAWARTHHMAGRLAEAAAVHNELLRNYRGHALSHYELGLIYEEMERTGDAKREFAKFLDMWSKADEGLPQLVDARHRLAALN